MGEGLGKGARLEISLIQRTRMHQGASAAFSATVVGAGTTKHDHRFLQILSENGTQSSIYLRLYLLRTINWKPADIAPLDTVVVESSPEKQNEGFEVICHILEQAGIKTQAHEKEPQMNTPRHGPRRAEVTLVQRSALQVQVQVVVTDCLPPKEPFSHYMIKGRKWVQSTKRLEGVIVQFSSEIWYVSRVQLHKSPGTTQSSFHNQYSDEPGWAKVKEFMDTLRPAEMQALVHFRYHPNRDDKFSATHTPAGGGTSHYRNPYQPATVFFRVAGDEVGKKSYLAQAETLVQSSDPDPPALKEFLETAQKKGEAEAASTLVEPPSALPEPSSALPEPDGRAETGSVGSRKDGAVHAGAGALPDHDPELADMASDEGLAFGAVPHLQGMADATDSALDALLNRYPMALRLGLHIGPSSGKRRRRLLH